MAKALYQVFYTGGDWNIAAKNGPSGPYTTWGEALAAAIETGHQSTKHVDAELMSQYEMTSDSVKIGKARLRRT